MAPPLVDCTSYYWREMWLRMLFFNEVPPWEDPALYSWSPTQFRLNLHKTADPGEAGTFVTNVADYAGYATQAVTRSSGAWDLVAPGTANARMETSSDVTWPPHDGAQDIYAVSIAIRVGSTDYAIARDTFAPVSYAVGESPSIAAGDFEFRWR